MGAVFGFTGPPDRTLVERMRKTLHHRGPKEFYFKEYGAMTLCCNSEFEDQERQRLCSGFFERQDISIVVSGYMTNVRNRELFEQNLFDRYKDKGLEAFDSLCGAYIIVVRDGNDLHLIRDGAGIKTVYYSHANQRVLFASEPKGILCDPLFERIISEKSLAKYLTFSFVPGPDTMLKNLYELESGHRISFQPGRVPVKKRWFVFESPGDPAQQSEQAWVDQFAQTLGEAVEKRLPQNEPVGVFLSGGIDSSAVTAEVASRHKAGVKTYSIHFGRKYAHELDFARPVAGQYKTDHEEVLIRPRDFLPKLRRIIWHMDDPVGDPVTVPNFELAERAARDVRYVFNGEGGDPCFGGPKNIPMLLQHWYGGLHRDPLFFEKKYLQSFQRAYNELDTLFTDSWRRAFSIDGDLAPVVSPFFQADEPQSYLNKLQVANIRLKAAHLIYPKVERMTGANGITPLSPLTDEKLMKLGFAMPPILKLKNGIEKYILKKAFEGRLPPEVIQRPKSGMRVPVRFWFQGEMKYYSQRILSRESIEDAGIFNYSRIRQILDYNKEEGQGRYGLQLWMLITFEIWRRIVVEGEAL